MTATSTEMPQTKAVAIDAFDHDVSSSAAARVPAMVFGAIVTATNSQTVRLRSNTMAKDAAAKANACVVPTTIRRHDRECDAVPGSFTVFTRRMLEFSGARSVSAATPCSAACQSTPPVLQL